MTAPRRPFVALARPALLVTLLIGVQTLVRSEAPVAAQNAAAADYVLADAVDGAALAIAAVDDSTVVAGLGPRVGLLDVSDGAAPRVIGRTELLPSAPVDLAADPRARLAVAALSGDGLATIDLSDPERPRLAGRLCLPRRAVGGDAPSGPVRPPIAGPCGAGEGRSVRAVAAAGDGTTAFAGADGGLLVADVADPYWPRALAWLPLDVAVRAVAAVPGAVLVLGSVADGADAGNRLIVVDVREPQQPAVRAWLKLGGDPGAFVDAAAAGGVAVAGGAAGGAVIDLSDLDRPRVAARIDRFVAAVDVRGDGRRTVAALALTVTDGTSGSRVFQDIAAFDVTSPGTPRLVGSRSTVTDVGLNALAMGPITAAAPWLATTSSVAGCTVYDLPAAGPIVAAGEVLTSGAIRVATDGAGHALVVEGDPRGVNPLSRLVVVDIALGEAIGVLSGLDSVGALAADGDRAYVIEVGHGVRIVSVADPAAPRTIGFLTTFFLPQHVAAAGGLLAVSDIFGTVQLLDAADPARVRVLAAIGAPPTDDNGGPLAIDIGLRGGRLFIARHDRLAVFDVQEPRQPKALGEVLYDSTEGLSVAPNLGVGAERVWVASLQGGVIAFDARNPLPRRIGRFPDLAAERIVEVGGRAIVPLAAPPASGAGGTGALAVVEAPLGGVEGGVVGVWTPPGVASDLAPDPLPGSLGLLVASGPYGLTSWRLRAERAATATPTAAAPRPIAPRPTRTAVPPDARWPHRAYLPLVARGANGARRAEGLSLVAAMGGAVTSVAIDGDIGYVAEADRLVALRVRSALRGASGRDPEPAGYAAVGERTIALAVSRRRLAALVGPPRALLATTVSDPGFGGALVAGGGGAEPPERPAGDGVAVRLFNIDDPIRPRPAARVALPGGAIDLAAGDADLIGWFAAVGAGADGGYIVLLDASDPAVPRTFRLDLGPDVAPLGVALSGRRALVQLDRGDASAVLLVDLARPDRPTPLGTLGGLARASGAGAVAAARDTGFVLTEAGLAAIRMTGRDPALLSEQPVNFFGAEPVFVAAVGSNIWVATPTGEIVQLAFFGGVLNAFNFERAPAQRTPEMRRLLAVTSGVLLLGGGLVGGASALEAPMIDLDGGQQAAPLAGPLGAPSGGPGAERRAGGGEVLTGHWGALGHSGAVAGGALEGVAVTANGDGSLVALETRGAGGLPLLRPMMSGGQATLPLPATGAAMNARMAMLVGPQTRLRSFVLRDGIAGFAAEPADDRAGGALDALRFAATARRVVLADGFAWVAERTSGIAVYDAAEPQPLTFVGRIETPGQPRDLAVRDGGVFVADGAAGLTIVDARNPASPRESGHLAAPGDVGAVALAADGRTAFIAVEGTGGAWLGSGRDGAAIWAVDVRDPARPRVVGSVGTDLSRTAALVVDGGRLYAAGLRGPAGGPLAPGGGTMAVAAFDVADPARLSEVGRWTAPDGYPYAPAALAKIGTRLVVAQGDGGLLVLEAGR